MNEASVPRLLVTVIAPDPDGSTSAAIQTARALNPEATVHARTFASADALVDSIDPATFDAWIMLEDAPKARKLVVEVTARNHVGGLDASGVGRNGVVEEDGPAALTASLWTKTVLWVPSLAWHVSRDAGEDVANYLLYRAVRRFPRHRIGLVRIPPAKALRVESGTTILVSLLERCVASVMAGASSGRPRPL